ncbi:uncharacterized protein LOC122198373 [Panthera leo]|uniref:uncharacterized protein LOC122198373 n=1 Tax=Panthera leo TaxID=9689 RepID=UPI001C694C56|nr:uncharacterized protein LOC122198373 [Panthera leo]
MYLLVEQDVYRIEWSARKRAAWFLLTRMCTCTVTTAEVSGRIALLHVTLTKEHVVSDVSRGSCLCCFAASAGGPLGAIDAALSRSGTCHTHPVLWSPVGAVVSALQVPRGASHKLQMRIPEEPGFAFCMAPGPPGPHCVGLSNNRSCISTQSVTVRRKRVLWFSKTVCRRGACPRQSVLVVFTVSRGAYPCIQSLPNSKRYSRRPLKPAVV